MRFWEYNNFAIPEEKQLSDIMGENIFLCQMGIREIKNASLSQWIIIINISPTGLIPLTIICFAGKYHFHLCNLTDTLLKQQGISLH